MNLEYRITMKYPHEIKKKCLILFTDYDKICKITDIQIRKTYYNTCVYIFIGINENDENDKKIYKTTFYSYEFIKKFSCLNKKCYYNCKGSCKKIL